MKTVPNIAFVARRAETCLVELLCFLLAFVRVETIVLLSPPCTNAFPLAAILKNPRQTNTITKQ